jgi:hypothetical protein
LGKWSYTQHSGAAALLAQQLRQDLPTKTTCPFENERREHNPMSNPIEKTKRKPLVHRPWDVLDSFGHYDAGSESWIQFDEVISEQIRELEEKNRQYIRPTATFNRRSSR